MTPERSRLHILLGLAALAGSACGSGGAGLAAAPPPAGGPAPATPAGPAADLEGLTSLQFAQRMGAGWNLGNALEATGGETGWGNPPATRRLFDAVKAAGFGNVRIPVAWRQYADAQDTIRPAWLARVAQVVDDALAAGLVVTINQHWDGGWLQPTYAAQPEANRRLARYWTQIAEHFKRHDERLLFASTNEVMVEGDYGTPTPEYRAVQNGFNQLFVSTVRATGGNNARRHLVVQGFNTNIDHTVNFAVLPQDPTAGRLMMEVHYYDPYHFTIDEKSALWQWGAGATDPKAKDSWGDETHLEAQFRKMKTRFIDRGVPVILGEYGVIARPHIAGSERYRIDWNRAVTRSARRHGLVPVYWDNGATGHHGMGLFERASGAPVHPELIHAIVDAAR
jgi:endoglucanase